MKSFSKWPHGMASGWRPQSFAMWTSPLGCLSVLRTWELASTFPELPYLLQLVSLRVVDERDRVRQRERQTTGRHRDMHRERDRDKEIEKNRDRNRGRDRQTHTHRKREMRRQRLNITQDRSWNLFIKPTLGSDPYPSTIPFAGSESLSLSHTKREGN